MKIFSLLFYKREYCMYITRTILGKYSILSLDKPGNGRRTKIFQGSKINFFLCNASFIPTIYEFPCQWWQTVLKGAFSGEGKASPLPRSGQSSSFSSAGRMRSCWHWTLSPGVPPEEAMGVLDVCTSRGLGKNQFGVKCLFFRFK